MVNFRGGRREEGEGRREERAGDGGTLERGTGEGDTGERGGTDNRQGAPAKDASAGHREDEERWESAHMHMLMLKKE